MKIARYTHASRYFNVPAGTKSNNPIATASATKLSNVFVRRLLMISTSGCS